MNKGLIVILFGSLISSAFFKVIADQQKCNMKTGITAPKDCHDTIASTTYRCCYEFMRLVTLNTVVCKYLKLTDVDQTEVDAEFDLLSKLNAKNVTLDCGSNHFQTISLLLIVFGLLF